MTESNPPGRRGRDEAAAPKARAADLEPVAPEQLVASLVKPIHERVIDEHEVEENRRFRRQIEEFLEEIETGLTPFVAGRANRDFIPEVESWFQRRDASRAASQAELAGLLEVMGKALKTMKGDDQVFHEGLDSHLARLRNTADDVQVRSVSRRLQAILDSTIAHGERQRRARERRIRSLSELVRGLHEQLDEARLALAEDPLTGLYNRGSFDDRLEAELTRARLAPYDFALIMLDLDHFKAINDEHLHVGGDRVLIACAKAIQSVVLRKSDFCARYGGEEMTVILADCTGEDARRVAESIRARIEGLKIDLGTGIARPTASFGVTSYEEGDRAEGLVRRADRAMYQAKRAGRNQVVLAGERRQRAKAAMAAGTGERTKK